MTWTTKDHELHCRSDLEREVFVFEEVEQSQGGYHTLTICNGKVEERPWSEPYRKSGIA